MDYRAYVVGCAVYATVRMYVLYRVCTYVYTCTAYLVVTQYPSGNLLFMRGTVTKIDHFRRSALKFVGSEIVGSSPRFVFHVSIWALPPRSGLGKPTV